MNKQIFSSLPSIILCRPQMGENIGAVARAMSNFGFSDLRLVSPRDGWPNPKAYTLAAGGAYVLDNATVHSCLEEAICDLEFLYGTAANLRDTSKKTIKSNEIYKYRNKTGVLFGCESNGLSNDELKWCDAIITISTNHQNTSLNLGQAACILMYEFSKLQDISNSIDFMPNTEDTVVSKKQVISLYNFLQDRLDNLDFFSSQDKKKSALLNLNDLLMQICSNINAKQFNLLYGVIKHLSNK